jgi:hypothetical protein
MMSNTAIAPQAKPQNRATTPTSGLVKWVEPTLQEEQEYQDYIPRVRNKSEYFDNLQKAVAGLSALLRSEMSVSEILKQAEMEVKKIETESYDVVKEFLGEEVTNRMKRINNDLDELASLVLGIEASLAGFSPLIEPEENQARKSGLSAA